MINIEKYRIIDLSAELQPGIRRVNGEYIHGKNYRKLEIHEFIYAPDKTFMNWVYTESHIGTHVELPAHYERDGKSSSEMAISSFIGEAIVLKLENIRPQDGMGRSIEPQNLGEVNQGDIVLMWSPYKNLEAPFISPKAAKALAEKNPRLLGVQNVRVESSPESMVTHESLLKKGIAIVEGLVNLESVRKDRVFYIGLPLKIYGLDSSWIRAIILEEKD